MNVFAFLSIMDERETEIDQLLETMSFLENKENLRNEAGLTYYNLFFEPRRNGILAYNDLVNILKSNIVLMIYNLIEYCITELIRSIYEKIESENLSYSKVSVEIKAIWRKSILKAANDPSANFNTFLSKNEEILAHILEEKVIVLLPKEAIADGSLDCDTIEKTFSWHGIKQFSPTYYRASNTFSKIKSDRNNLTHGSVSFSEALREKSINDIKAEKETIKKVLDELINKIEEYINTEMYKAKEA